LNKNFSYLEERERIGDLFKTLCRGAPVWGCSSHGGSVHGRERLMPQRGSLLRGGPHYVHSGVIMHPIETKKLTRVDLQTHRQCAKRPCPSNWLMFPRRGATREGEETAKAAWGLSDLDCLRRAEGRPCARMNWILFAVRPMKAKADGLLA